MGRRERRRHGGDPPYESGESLVPPVQLDHDKLSSSLTMIKAGLSPTKERAPMRLRYKRIEIEENVWVVTVTPEHRPDLAYEEQIGDPCFGDVDDFAAFAEDLYRGHLLALADGKPNLVDAVQRIQFEMVPAAVGPVRTPWWSRPTRWVAVAAGIALFAVGATWICRELIPSRGRAKAAPAEAVSTRPVSTATPMSVSELIAWAPSPAMGTTEMAKRLFDVCRERNLDDAIVKALLCADVWSKSGKRTAHLVAAIEYLESRKRTSIARESRRLAAVFKRDPDDFLTIYERLITP